MNQQFSTSQGFPSQFVNSSRHPSVPTSAAPQNHAIQYPAASGPHTLPPIGTPLYGPNMGHQTYGSSAPPFRPSMTTTSSAALHQPLLLPVYGPTSTTYFSADPPVPYAHPHVPHQSIGSSIHQYAPQQPPSHATQTLGSQPSRLPDLLPMPNQSIGSSNIVHPRGGVRSMASAQLPASAQPAGGEPAPVHVVGSQGRRGILPSATGKPPAIGENAPPGKKGKGPPTPAKNADGKYPCQHCVKTYQHAKHLKRHMLRHTGDRPYTCGLCKDTFSRSDILKRHFQKCSARRGNPTGESHLTHSRASKKAKAEATATTPSSADETITPSASEPSQPSSAFATTSFGNPLDLQGLSAHFPETQHQSFDQNPRTDVPLRQKPSRNSSNRGSMGVITTTTYESNNYGYSTGQVTPESITTSGAATPYTYPHEARQSQMSPEDQLATGLGIPSAAGNRPSLGSSYSTGSLPHIVQPSIRSQDLDWIGPHSQYLSTDEFGQPHYHSGAVTPQIPKEDMEEFLNHHNLHFPK